MNPTPYTNTCAKASPKVTTRSAWVEKPQSILPNDAIPLGRGWNKSDRISTLHAMYQRIIEKNAADYVQAEKKTIVSQRIAKRLEAEGIRFVRWNQGSSRWEDASVKSVLKKISAACRESKHAKHSKRGPPGNLKKANVITVDCGSSNDPSSPHRVNATSTTTDIATVSGLSILSQRQNKGGSSPRYALRSKKARSNPKARGEEGHCHPPAWTPATTALPPPEFQPPKTNICARSCMLPGAILTPIVSSDDTDKETPKEKEQGGDAGDVSQDYATLGTDAMPDLSDTFGSPRETEPWWTGMLPDQSPFLTGTEGLFDRTPSEPPSPLGLSSALQLLSDFEGCLEHSALSNLSPSFSITPCKFESLEEFKSNSLSDDVDVLASPTKGH